MVVEAPQMSPVHREAALGSQIAQLQIRNTWLERQVLLEQARVPQSYVGRELEGASMDQLEDMSPQDQANMFKIISARLDQAAITEERPLASSIPIRNLEWNGELPHPTWQTIRHLDSPYIGRDDARRINREAESQGNWWTILEAIRHDGTGDRFSVRTISLPNFRYDMSPVFAGAPDIYGNFKKSTPVADKKTVAELFDFTRGVRGGLKVVGYKNSSHHFSSDD